MGGKSSSAPPPDPRLVEAQLKSMGIQDNAIEGILGLQKQMQPLQMEQMQFGLDSGRKAFQQSQDDREFALGKRGQLSGLQDQMSNEARSFNTDAKQDELAGTAIGDVNQAFSAARAGNARSMARMGVNPSDGASVASGNQMAVSQALGQAQAANGTRVQARAEGRAMTDRATNALAGYPSMSMSATGQGAQFGALGLNTANQGMAGMSSGYGSAAQIAGNMGTNATGAWGQQANYKSSQDKEANSGFGAALGTAGTLVGTALPYLLA